MESITKLNLSKKVSRIVLVAALLVTMSVQVKTVNPQYLEVQLLDSGDVEIHNVNKSSAGQSHNLQQSRASGATVAPAKTTSLSQANKQQESTQKSAPQLSNITAAPMKAQAAKSGNATQATSKTVDPKSQGAMSKNQSVAPLNKEKLIDYYQQYLKKHKLSRLNPASLKDDKHHPEQEYDTYDPEPDKNTWDSQAIKYPTNTDFRKRFRTKKFNWWEPTYESKLQDYQEKFLKYGYNGEGFKAGTYYTKYISTNPKFYSKDKFYGTEIYTPFWNHMRNKYQQVDCGIDCEYLGPKDYLGNMLIYVLVFVAFLIVASLAACNKQKYDQDRQIERAREFGQNVLQL